MYHDYSQLCTAITNHSCSLHNYNACVGVGVGGGGGGGGAQTFMYA